VNPFESWYATNIEANLPSDVPPQVREVAKEQAAQIWNAAIQQVLYAGVLTNEAQVATVERLKIS
jgi:hypothetical protein